MIRPAPFSRRLTRRVALLVVLLACLALAFPGCSPLYVIRASWEEAGILMRREKIDDLVQSTDTEDSVRHKLELVKEAREFSLTLDLEPKESFTYYSSVDRDVLVWVLSAAPKTQLESYNWWFPIVGSVPYKGFFEKEDAIAAAKKLSEQGYDIYIRPSQAFSTLGWFNDPILSTMIGANDVPLVDTVIHEILHNTLWIPNHVSFNESLANFVGAHGAVEFFGAKVAENGSSPEAAKAVNEAPAAVASTGETSVVGTPVAAVQSGAAQAAQSPAGAVPPPASTLASTLASTPASTPAELLQSAQDRLQDQLLFARFISDLSTDLKALYGSADFKSSDNTLTPSLAAQRDGVFANYRNRFDQMKPQFRSAGYKRNVVEFNNASVIADSLYYDRLWEFEDLFRRSGSSLVKFIAVMKELGKKIKERGSDPFVELERLISEMPEAAGQQGQAAGK